MLNLLFRKSKGIKFLSGDQLEYVVNVAGKNILLIHGHQKVLGPKPHEGIARIVRKYADKGICIAYVILGHIHEAYIADMYSRGSSLVGSNTWSDRDLQLTSRASQNIHIIKNSGDINSIKVDLQDTTGFKGYDINEKIAEYNAKSAARTQRIIPPEINI